jgi:hypothetical protein
MVWSDPRIQELARDFVVVADEVHFLYPEDAHSLARVANDPAHVLFKRFGESMPAGDWHHPGTKQGVYMMGPDGEYLEGSHFVSGNRAEIATRLERARERWQTLRKAKGYANKPIPPAPTNTPPEFAQAPALLRVSLRDLRPGQRAATPRWRAGAFDDNNWLAFTQWAWNQNWFALAEPRAFVTKDKTAVAVDAKAFRRLCRAVLVDNVRGQAPEWQEEHVQLAELTMRRIDGGKFVTLEYTGEARMDAGGPKLAVRLYGQAEWDEANDRFVRFDLVALGTREGAWPFHQRGAQQGPSPIGIALRLHAPAPATKAAR